MRRSSRGAGMLNAIFENLPWIILALVLLGFAGLCAVVARETREVRRDLRDIDASLKREDLQW